MRLVLMAGLIVVGALTSLVYLGPLIQTEPLPPKTKETSLSPDDSSALDPARDPVRPRASVDLRPIAEPSPANLKSLTVPARETFDALFEAARSGQLEAVSALAEAGNDPPALANTVEAVSEPNVGRALADFASQSGRPIQDVLRELARVLSVAPATRRGGRDVENNEVFIWPSVSTEEPGKFNEAARHQTSVIFPADEAARIAATGRYDGFAVVIGADGRWRALRFPSTIRTR